MEAECKKGVKNGITIENIGGYCQKYSMKQGKYDGIYILQHDGRTVQERIYQEGKLNGQSRYDDEGGPIMCIETYKDGRLQ